MMRVACDMCRGNSCQSLEYQIQNRSEDNPIYMFNNLFCTEGQMYKGVKLGCL